MCLSSITKTFEVLFLVNLRLMSSLVLYSFEFNYLINLFCSFMSNNYAVTSFIFPSWDWTFYLMYNLRTIQGTNLWNSWNILKSNLEHQCLDKMCSLHYFEFWRLDKWLDVFPIKQVEQLHKIFKLCGSPPDDYWKKSKLPHATLFKPQHPYESFLWQTFKDLPKTAVILIETLLSVEPYKRGTASSTLESEVFINISIPSQSG